MFGTILRRSLDIAVAALARHDDPLDAVDKACRKDFAMYGTYFDIDFERVDPATFEMPSAGASSATSSRATVSGLRSERTSLLSLGDDRCTFRVLETDDPLAEHEDALSRRFTADA